ncbi:MAG: hypothetical protein ACYC61_11260 [Isosphaeraceae bacterium]
MNAVVDRTARQYMRCNEGPCSSVSSPWIWRCGCDSHYIENVGDHCGGCGRHRRLARSYEMDVLCPFCENHYDVDDREGIGRQDACPSCAEPDYKPVPYDIAPLAFDTGPDALCQALLDAAEAHGLATEGAEMAWGDVEELFRAAFELLTDEQRDRFWEDERVWWLVGDCPEYDAIAEVIYGPSDDDEEVDDEEADDE